MTVKNEKTISGWRRLTVYNRQQEEGVVTWHFVSSEAINRRAFSGL